MPHSKTAEQGKPAKKYGKTRGEHYKDIVIAVLIAGIISFLAGMHFANQQHADTAKAVQSATAEPVKK